MGSRDNEAADQFGKGKPLTRAMTANNNNNDTHQNNNNITHQNNNHSHSKGNGSCSSIGETHLQEVAKKIACT